MQARERERHIQLFSCMFDPGMCGPREGEAAGRECPFEIESKPLEDVRDYLERVSQQWDEALAPAQDLCRDVGRAILAASGWRFYFGPLRKTGLEGRPK